MKRANLFCKACCHAWGLLGVAYEQRTAIKWVIIKGQGVQRCPNCGVAENVVILNRGNGMKCSTRLACVQRYGPIDFASAHWHDQNKWMVNLAIEPSWFPKWVYAGTKKPVDHIYVNKDMVEPLKTALYSVHAKGLGELLHTYDGCLAIRMVRGTTSSFSAHSYGLAIDLNAAENPLGATHGGFFNHPDFVKCFTDVGFDSGCNFHSRKDAMHFSYCFE